MEPHGAQTPAIAVQHERGRHRYGAVCGSEVLAVLYYEEQEGPSGALVRDLRSTVVDPAHNGEGLGSRLVRRALADARRDGAKVQPTCWFARGWIERHPDFADLLVSSSAEPADESAPAGGAGGEAAAPQA